MSGKLHGSCHCGAVEFEVALSDWIATASRCTCSYCAQRGLVAVTAPRAAITLLKGADVLTLYQFGTKTAEHYFCSICGIHTHYRRRSKPDEIGVNLACLDAHSPFLPELPVHDGQHHPSDTGQSTRLAGKLLFIPTEGEA